MSTLLDIFNAVTFTEESALSVNHPSSPRLPNQLVDRLSSVISREVFWMMSTTGVHAFLNCLVGSIDAILCDVSPSGEGLLDVVQEHIAQGRVINTFKWMPHEWVLSLDVLETTHDVFVLNDDDSPSPINVMMRLEPFIGMVNRSVDLFKSFNNALVTLYSLERRTEF